MTIATVRDAWQAVRAPVSAAGAPMLAAVDAVLAALGPGGDPVPSPWPAWRQGKPVGVIFTVPGTKPSSIGYDPPAGWNGVAAHGTKMYFIAASGHANSQLFNPDPATGYGWQNPVAVVDMKANAPAWSLVDVGSTKAVVAAGGDTRTLSDGRRHGRHVYDSAHYIANRNSLVLFGAGATVFSELPGLYKGGPHVDGFNLDSKTWEPESTYPNVPPMGDALVKSIASHPVTGDVYLSANQVFIKWTNATNTFSPFSPLAGTLTGTYDRLWQYKGSCIDVMRNAWVHIGKLAASSGATLRFIDLATRAGSIVQITGDVIAPENYSALTHDEDGNRYIAVHGNKVYGVTPAGVSTLLGTLPVQIQGMENRAVYMKELGGVAFIPSGFVDVHFMPTRAQ